MSSPSPTRELGPYPQFRPDRRVVRQPRLPGRMQVVAGDQLELLRGDHVVQPVAAPAGAPADLPALVAVKLAEDVAESVGLQATQPGQLRLLPGCAAVEPQASARVAGEAPGGAVGLLAARRVEVANHDLRQVPPPREVRSERAVRAQLDVVGP